MSVGRRVGRGRTIYPESMWFCIDVGLLVFGGGVLFVGVVIVVIVGRVGGVRRLIGEWLLGGWER